MAFWFYKSYLIGVLWKKNYSVSLLPSLFPLRKSGKHIVINTNTERCSIYINVNIKVLMQVYRQCSCLIG